MDGPARRSSSVNRAWWMGPPPTRSPRATAGRDRMTGSPRRSSSQGTACGSRTRALGTRAYSRTNRPLEKKARHDGRARSRVGWTSLPLTPEAAHRSVEHPLRTLSRRVWSRTGRFGISLGIFVFHPIAVSFDDDRLPVMHQPVDQGRGQGVVRVTQGAPFPERSIRG